MTLKALRRMLEENPDQVFKKTISLKLFEGSYVFSPNKVPLVWIHDYHLMLAANTIRQTADEENLSCKIGFFLHIPFPPWDLLKIFPWEDMILQGILGCDLVGFHIEDYCLNFLDSCQRGLGLRVDRRAMLTEHGGRTVRVRPLPIGIPFGRFETMAKEATVGTLSASKDIKVEYQSPVAANYCYGGVCYCSCCCRLYLLSCLLLLLYLLDA